jgi:hypothetical protein
MKDASPIRQIHVRVSAALKKAVKMLCVREGTTEQAWVHGLIEDRLKRQAPDLWPGQAGKAPATPKPKAR